jgi:hypothetical protein
VEVTKLKAVMLALFGKSKLVLQNEKEIRILFPFFGGR